jgi:hypothetical protein
MTMAKHIGSGTDMGEEQDDRRMNAYMAGVQSTSDDGDDEEEESSPRRRKGRSARKGDYSV